MSLFVVTALRRLLNADPNLLLAIGYNNLGLASLAIVGCNVECDILLYANIRNPRGSAKYLNNRHWHRLETSCLLGVIEDDTLTFHGLEVHNLLGCCAEGILLVLNAGNIGLGSRNKCQRQA